MQIDNDELFLKLCNIQRKETGNKQERKTQFLNAMKTKITFVKGRLNVISKRIESLFDNWLKNNHITINLIYYLRSGFFTSFSFQTYFSTALILGAKTLWHQKS